MAVKKRSTPATWHDPDDADTKVFVRSYKREKGACSHSGSDEAIDLLLRVFCRAGQDSILVCPPTYSMYAVAAGIQGAAVLRVPLRAADGCL